MFSQFLTYLSIIYFLTPKSASYTYLVNICMCTELIYSRWPLKHYGWIKGFLKDPVVKRSFVLQSPLHHWRVAAAAKKGLIQPSPRLKLLAAAAIMKVKKCIKNISIRRRETIENYKSFKKKMRQSSKFSWIATAVWRSHLDKAQITIISELACCAALLLIWIFASFESRKVGSSRKKYFLCTLSCLLLDSRRKWLLLPPTPLQKYAPQSPFVRPQQT